MSAIDTRGGRPVGEPSFLLYMVPGLAWGPAPAAYRFRDGL